MAQLLLDDNVKMQDLDDEDMLANPDEVNNYKGMYQNDDDESEQKYFEFGAHFAYDVLYRRLEDLRKILPQNRKESPLKENQKEGMININFKISILENPQGLRGIPNIFLYNQNRKMVKIMLIVPVLCQTFQNLPQ
jgi:hypothetical protein